LKPPEEIKQELVRQWLARADEDLETAKFLFANQSYFFTAICFHCQQATEKYFKAYLTRQQIEFPETHDLGLLLDLIASADSSLAASLREVVVLNPYGVEIRYPGEAPEITREDAEKAISLANRLKEAISLSLKETP